MSFKSNSSQQITFTDSFNGLTFREQKALENSWVKHMPKIFSLP